MDFEDFLKNFEAELRDCDKGKVTESTIYKELQSWDSMLALCVIAMIDSVYGIQIDSDDLTKSETVKDLFNIVSSKKDTI